MSIIESLKTFISAYDGLPSKAKLAVNELNSKIGSFSIDPLPGARTVSIDLDGTKTKEYPFVLSSMECTADEASRLQSSGFYEDFAQWLEACTDEGTMPDLGAGKEAEKLESTTWAYLFRREADAASAIYQINCKLTYSQGG